MKRELLLAVLFVFMVSSLSFSAYAAEITSKATSENVGMRIVVGGKPSIELYSPVNGTYLISNITFNFWSSFGSNVWYNIDQEANLSAFSGMKVNLSEGSHTLYIFVNDSEGVTEKNVAFYINVTKIRIVYDEFFEDPAANSTDFQSYSYEQLENLSDITFDRPQYGKIVFLEGVNVVGVFNVHNGTVDFDKYVNISSNMIFFDSDNLKAFKNIPATLQLSNLSFSNPQVLRDGQPCGECTLHGYVNGTLQFKVPGFTTYSIREAPLTNDVSKGVIIEGGEEGGGAGGEAVIVAPPGEAPAPSGCVEKWNCSEWSECKSGLQNRQCSDLNLCGTENDIPPLSKICYLPEISKKNAYALLMAFAAMIIATWVLLALLKVRRSDAASIAMRMIEQANHYISIGEIKKAEEIYGSLRRLLQNSRRKLSKGESRLLHQSGMRLHEDIMRAGSPRQ